MNPLEWLIWAIIGLVIGGRVGLTAGGLSDVLRPGRGPGGGMWAVLCGVLGALMGGWLWVAEFGDEPSSFLAAAIFGLAGALAIQYFLWRQARR